MAISKEKVYSEAGANLEVPNMYMKKDPGVKVCVCRGWGGVVLR